MPSPVEKQARWLADTLVELADTLDEDLDDAVYVHVVTERLVELLAPADVGLRVEDTEGKLTLASSSSSRTNDLVAFDVSDAAGPCTWAYRMGWPLVNVDLETAGSRWPEFAAAAKRLGFRTVTALPMRHRQTPVGAAVVLTAGTRLSDATVSAADAVIRAAAVGLLGHRALRSQTNRATDLQRALDSRVLVEQAKGMTAARLGLTPSAAFDLLRDYARARRLRMDQVAYDVVHGTPPGELVAKPFGVHASRPPVRDQSG